MTTGNTSMKIHNGCSAMFVIAAACLLTFTFAAGSRAQVTGLNYAIAPSFHKVFWNDNAAVRDGMFYGGQIGFGFGRYFEMSGMYMRGDAFRTDFSKYTKISPPLFVNLQSIPSRDLKLELIGGEARFNLGSGALVPFVTLGTGVMRSSAEGLERSDNIYWSGGVGFFYALDDRFTLTVSGQDLAYRHNPVSGLLGQADYTASGLQPADFGRTTVHNWGVRAGVRAFLGGRRDTDVSELDREILAQFSGGFSGLSVQLTPFVGHIDFNKALGMPDGQDLAGVNVGLGFGPFIGIRGFYWRGLEEGNAAKFDKIQLYGGEVNLKLNTGEGAIPFFLVGIGRLDVLDGYRGGPSGPSQDQTFAVAGGGLNFNLSKSIRLQGAVRSILISSSGTDVSNPSSIYGNPMYSIGINFAIGAGPGRPDVVRKDVMKRSLDKQTLAHRRELEKLMKDAASVEDSLTAEIARAEIRGDSAAVNRMKTQKVQASSVKEQAIAEAAISTAITDTVFSVEVDTTGIADQAVDGPAGTSRPTNVSDKVIMIPVPEEGEVYIRYGKPGSVTIETIPGELPEPATVVPAGSAVRGDTARRGGDGSASAAPGAGGTSIDSAALAAMEQRIMDRLEKSAQLNVGRDADRISDLEGRMAGLRSQIDDSRRDDGVKIVERRDPGGDVTIVQEGAPETVRGLKLHSVYTGLNIISGHTQGLAGVKADYGTIFGGKVWLLPEFTFGFAGGTTSYLVAVNAVVPMRIAQIEPIAPYAGIGAGLLAFTTTPADFSGIQGAFNLLLGAGYKVGSGSAYVEYSGINLFDLNRILIGYRFGL